MPTDNIKAGTECWAWAWDWPKGFSMPVAAQKPVRGMLTEHPDRIGDETHAPGWFVPYSGKSRRPAFTKAVRMESMHLCSDKKAAEVAYNAAVQLTMKWLQSCIFMCQDSMVKNLAAGFDEKGDMLEHPVFAADLSRNHGDLLRIFQSAPLEPKPETLRDSFTWKKCQAMIGQGTLRPGYGVLDILIDGKGSEHALMDMHRGCLLLDQKYLVFFEQIEDVFKGHEIRCIWFPEY